MNVQMKEHVLRTFVTHLLVHMHQKEKIAREIEAKIASGASVAKWLAHLPFTSEAAGSNLTKYFLNATRTQSSCEKSKKSTLCRKSWVFPGYSGFLPQGKLTGWVRQIKRAHSNWHMLLW
jgi:hypothetical protein